MSGLRFLIAPLTHSRASLWIHQLHHKFYHCSIRCEGHLTFCSRPACQFSHTHSPAFSAKTTSFRQALYRYRNESRAYGSTITTESQPRDVELGSEGLVIQLDGREIMVPLVWLRDHCRCPVCYNAVLFQKNVDCYSLGNLAVMESQVDGDTLSVKWQDDHTSLFSLQWLSRNLHSPGTKVERFLWDGLCMNKEQLPTTLFDHHMNFEDGLKNTLKNIIKYGFCIVDGTVYGGLHTMVSGDFSHSDTAYSKLPLGAHTDTTYYTLPAGIQVFHCLHHDGEGGKTLLVDGFNAAEKLRGSNPSYFDTLVTMTIPHEYIEGSHYHLYSLGTVLSTDLTTGALTQIRFNPYDRAPLNTVHPADIVQFYRSYTALQGIIRRQESEFWIKLKPGMVLLVDNWRVMHGRSGFTGKRVICGCYLPRDDWMSHARVLGLL